MNFDYDKSLPFSLYIVKYFNNNPSLDDPVACKLLDILLDEPSARQNHRIQKFCSLSLSEKER